MDKAFKVCRIEKSHTMAENTGFVSCFLKGVVDKGSYRTLVADLYVVYSAMEEEMARLSGHPVLAPIAFPELNRREALEQDLTYYYGSDWAQVVKATPAASCWWGTTTPATWAISPAARWHHYTRYLGDLSGGQILKTIAQKAMNLSGDEGLNFYSFPAIADEKAFKTTYRAAMDQLPIDQATADRIVEEANEGNLVAAIGKVLFGFLTRRQRAGSTEAVAA